MDTDHDQLFKQLLSTFFLDFLELFFPEVMTYLELLSTHNLLLICFPNQYSLKVGCIAIMKGKCQWMQPTNRDVQLRKLFDICALRVISLTGSIVFSSMLFLPSVLNAQENVEYFAAGNFRISPTLYFDSAATELSSRQALHSKISTLVDKIAASKFSALVQELDEAWRIMSALQHHGAYLRVQSLENTQDQAAKDAYSLVTTDESVLEAAINSRLRQVPKNRISALGPYTLLARNLQAEAAHAFLANVQRYRGSVSEPLEQDIADAYDQLIDSLGSDQGVTSIELATRRAAIAQRTQADDAVAPTAATLLAMLIDIENKDAIVQGYENAAQRKYATLGLNTKMVDKTLSAVMAEAPTFRKYQQLIAEHAAKTLGVSPILSSEQDLAQFTPPAIPFDQGRQLILDALKPLGPNYTQRFSQLLDPINGRLDLSGGTHRAHTGTSIQVYDAPVALYLSGYDGSLKSVSKIAHEGGHAIHRELMNLSGIPIYEREGPHFLFEGFAIFNELLLLDHATKIAKTPAQREYALERLLRKISVELFTSAEETSFERNLYTEATSHTLFNRAKIDSVYRDSIAPYEYWPMSDVGTSSAWMRKSLLFEDPLYLVNYLYAAFVAVALYDKVQVDPDFSRKYEVLLRRGFDCEPTVLLASIGIRLDDPTLAKRAVKFFASKSEELQGLYAADH